MNCRKYEELYRTVLNEHREVFEKQDLDEVTLFMEQIRKDTVKFLDLKYMTTNPKAPGIPFSKN